MSTELRSTLRAVILPSPEAHPHDTPTRRLLGELGLEVARAVTPDHALELLGSEHTDLLVVDLTNNNANRLLIDSWQNLPANKRPVQVAIFTDASDARLREFRREAAPSNVHVFLKPLHMHGLLNVLRRMENDLAQEAEA